MSAAPTLPELPTLETFRPSGPFNPLTVVGFSGATASYSKSPTHSNDPDAGHDTRADCDGFAFKVWRCTSHQVYLSPGSAKCSHFIEFINATVLFPRAEWVAEPSEELPWMRKDTAPQAAQGSIRYRGNLHGATGIPNWIDISDAFQASRAGCFK